MNIGNLTVSVKVIGAGESRLKLKILAFIAKLLNIPIETRAECKPKKLKINCKHEEFLSNIFDSKIQSPREYWLYTEMFVYLHGGKDYCNCKESR